MTGNAELVTAIEPEKIFFTGTCGGLASLDHTFFMRIVAGAAKDAVTVKRQLSMLHPGTLRHICLQKVRERHKVICPGGVSGLLPEMAVDTIK